jgi:hypothetical protein
MELHEAASQMVRARRRALNTPTDALEWIAARLLSWHSVSGMSRNDDISTRGGENAKRIALDQAVILAAQLQTLESMAKAHDAEYCTHAEALLEAKRQGRLAGSDRTLV